MRYLVGDDPGQAARARRLIDNNDVFVCTTVLLETEWVLRSVYGFSAVQCAKALSDFAGLPRATWANLESGSANPTLAVVHRVASALQISLGSCWPRLAPPRASTRRAPCRCARAAR